jgi:nucleoside-diphosphate-sugar epimerase
MKKAVTLLGASGLIGKKTLLLLLESESVEVVDVLVRRTIGITHSKLREHLITDFENLSTQWKVPKTDVLISCVGSTKKKTQNEADYRKIDFDIPVKSARMVKSMGCSCIIIISAVGADSQSGIFYNRLKGEVEEAIVSMKFPSTYILQPALLIGERQESRPMEKLAQKISPLFDVLCVGKFSKYHSITAEKVAISINRAVLQASPGIHIWQYNALSS